MWNLRRRQDDCRSGMYYLVYYFDGNCGTVYQSVQLFGTKRGIKKYAAPHPGTGETWYF